MSDRGQPTLPGVGVSIVRTAVPAAWGTLMAWLLSLGLPAEIAAAADRVDELLVLVCVISIYTGARWLERRPWMPGWLASVLLGSSRQPVYVHAAGGRIGQEQPLDTDQAGVATFEDPRRQGEPLR